MQHNFDDITSSLDNVTGGGFGLPGWAHKIVDKAKDTAQEVFEKGKQIGKQIGDDLLHNPGLRPQPPLYTL